MIKKYLKGLSVALLTSVFMITGIGCADSITNSDSISEDSKKLFTMKLKDDNATYGLNDNFEEIKITDDSNNNIRYLNDLDKYLVLENINSKSYETYDMYILNSDGEKTFICSNIYEDDFKLAYTTKINLYYKTADNTLFKMDIESNESTKVASNVSDFSVLDNEVLVYEANVLEIYVITDKEPLLLSNTGMYYTNGKDTLFYTKDNILYSYNIESNTSETIDKNGSGVIFNNDIGFMYYINDGTDSYSNSELKYKNYNKDSVTINKGIANFSLAEDGIYYTKYNDDYLKFLNSIITGTNSLSNSINSITSYDGDYYSGIYFFDYSTNKSTKINTEGSLIQGFNPSSKYTYIKNSDNTIDMVSKNGEVKYNYGEIVTSSGFLTVFPYYPWIFKDYSIILSQDGNLYFDSNKIATNIKVFISTTTSLAYITNDNKVYLIEEDEKPQLVIADATIYEHIYFNDNILYETPGYIKFIE